MRTNRKSERIIRIGDGENTRDVSAHYLTIVCPISDEDREHLAMQEHRNRIRDKELVEQMQSLVVQFEDQKFRNRRILRPHQRRRPRRLLRVRIPSERRVLYALLDYDDGRLWMVPVSDLCVVELFDAFWLLVRNA